MISERARAVVEKCRPMRKSYDGRLSIRRKIILSFMVIVMMMSILNIGLLYSSILYNKQYKTIIANIITANSISADTKTDIDSEMWNIVAGRTEFKDGKQYKILNDVETKIVKIMNNESSDESRTRLDVTLRTLETLRRYINQMGEQIKENKTVEENEKVLDDIRSVTSLVEDNIQEFVLYEIQGIEGVNENIQDSIGRWLYTDIIVLACILTFSIIVVWMISGSISKPIHELYNMTQSIAEGNLNVRVENKNVDEIAALGESFNIMTEKIKELLENSIEEQEALKKMELKLLQAQINPHFLYNTLDTIIWMAEGNKSEEVIDIVQALSSFFRTTLSKGNDMIAIRDEIEHIRSYLTIQKIRYRDILDYEIEADEDIMDDRVLKLTLQPIVENALYHGIKNKREGGKISIGAYKMNDDRIVFEVDDNGIGIEEDKLFRIQQEIENECESSVVKDSGFGLSNVNRRLRLNYGRDFGIKIKSLYKEGTKVTVVIPLER